MTVVAAMADIRTGTVVMAADTATNYAGTGLNGARKIRRIQTGSGVPMLLAASGNGALAQVIPRHLKVEGTPGPEAGEQDWDEWAEVISSAVAAIAADIKPPLTASDDSTCMDGALLLAAAGRIWWLFTHQALRAVDGIAVLGSGCDLALGVLHASELSPADRVHLAVLIACKHAAGCAVDDRGPQVEELR